MSHFIVEEYQKGTDFTTLVNRKVYGTAISNATDDSISFHKSYESLTVDRRFDTYVKVIKANKEYKIRDVSYFNEKEPIRIGLGERDPCSNTVSGYLNDEKFEGKGSDYHSGYISPVYIDLVK